MQLLANIPSEDRFGVIITAAVHLIIALVLFFYQFSVSQNVRPSFIEVEFGEYQTGTRAEFSRETNEQVQTSPTPSPVQPNNPEPVPPDPLDEQPATTEETFKPVELPEQQQEITEEEVKTPDTQKVDPEKKTTQETKKQTVIPPKARQSQTRQQGAQTSGDPTGSTGAIDADQGRGNEQQKQAPFNLRIEGVDRNPVQQPIPTNASGVQATLVLRFQVTPDGRVVNVFPVRKSGSPEIDREAIRTLNSWRFSSLPADLPQQNQTGTITFRFVVD